MKIHPFSAPVLIALFVFLGACAPPAAQTPANTPVPTMVEQAVTSTPAHPAPSPTAPAPTASPAPSPTYTASPASLALAPGAGVEGFGTIVGHTFAPFWDIADSGFGSLWLPHHDDPLHRISRVDLETGEVLAVIQVARNGSASSRRGDLFTATATNEGMWVNDVLENALVLIDPNTNEIVREINIGVAGLELAADGDVIWVNDPETSSVLRVNTASSQVEAAIEMGDAGRLTVGGGAVWVVENQIGRIARIDPATNAIAAEIAVPGFPEDVVFAEGSLWATVSGQAIAVVRIDPETNEIAARIALAGMPRDVWGLEYGKGALWVRVGPEGALQCNENFVARIDPATNSEVSRMVIPCVAHIAFAGDYLWAVIDPSPSLRKEMNLGAEDKLTVRIAPD